MMSASYRLPSIAPRFRRDAGNEAPAAKPETRSLAEVAAWIGSAKRAEADGDSRGAARKRRIAASVQRMGR